MKLINITVAIIVVIISYSEALINSANSTEIYGVNSTDSIKTKNMESEAIINLLKEIRRSYIFHPMLQADVTETAKNYLSKLTYGQYVREMNLLLRPGSKILNLENTVKQLYKYPNNGIYLIYIKSDNLSRIVGRRVPGYMEFVISVKTSPKIDDKLKVLSAVIRNNITYP